MASHSSGTTEYQHFVPQFLLRNFSKPYEPPKNEPGRQSKKRRGRGVKMYRGERVVSHVDLTADKLAIETTPVKRVLGMNNMYEDLAQATAKERHHIEEMFGRLESAASPVFRKITKAFEQGDAELWLTRDERNIVRKFLFLLKYRGSQFRRRFYHDTPEQYDSDDKMQLRQYMRDRGFQRPIDVWFDNLKAIAECKMDVEGKWMTDILERMYPEDAMWFRHHTQQSYMALCCPSEADAEFLLGENSYTVWEGISSFRVDMKAGEEIGSSWVDFHDFAPVSPKVMIVLRSFLLPLPEEDADPKFRKLKDQWWADAVDRPFGAGRRSELADLPIAKARNNYTELIDGQLRPLEPQAPRSKHDKFLFKFFHINRDHVNKINSFLLDNAHSSIVFASPAIFTRTLEWYMADTSQAWKNVVGTEDERNAKVILLTKLAALMKSLGSEIEPVWEEAPSGKSLMLNFTGQGPTGVLRSEYQKLLDGMMKNLDREDAMRVPPPTPFSNCIPS